MKKYKVIHMPVGTKFKVATEFKQSFWEKLKEWIYCRKHGHRVSKAHPLYPSQYCSVCGKHQSKF